MAAVKDNLHLNFIQHLFDLAGGEEYQLVRTIPSVFEWMTKTTQVK